MTWKSVRAALPVAATASSKGLQVVSAAEQVGDRRAVPTDLATTSRTERYRLMPGRDFLVIHSPQARVPLR